MINFNQKISISHDTLALFELITLLLTQKGASSDKKLVDFCDWEAYT
jgi:hypothetical protein